MKSGLLWFDDRKGIPLNTKIAEGVAYYRKKFGKAPTACEVSLAEFHALDTNQDAGAIAVHPDRFILPFHMLIGIEEIKS